MSKLPKRMRDLLNKEARDWDASIAKESPAKVRQLSTLRQHPLRQSSVFRERGF